MSQWAQERQPLPHAAASAASAAASAAAAEEGLAPGQAPSPPPPSLPAASREAACPCIPAVAPACCRICLSEDGLDSADSLEKPCACAGSMAFAHHSCIQKWILEKGDKLCEVCKTPFRGEFEDPPPPPVPLVAQLQVDNADNRIVLLSDPETGTIVARVLVPPGGEVTDVEDLPWGQLQAGHAGAAEEELEDEEEAAAGGSRRSCNPVLLLLLFTCIVGAFAWLAAASEAGGDSWQAGSWALRVALLFLWVWLRTTNNAVAPRRRRRVLTLADIEAGLQQRRQQQRQQPAEQ